MGGFRRNYLLKEYDSGVLKRVTSITTMHRQNYSCPECCVVGPLSVAAVAATVATLATRQGCEETAK